MKTEEKRDGSYSLDELVSLCECGSGDISLCNISHRYHCNECGRVFDSSTAAGSLSFDGWIETQPKWVRLCACKNTTIREAMTLAYSANRGIDEKVHL